MLPRLILQRSMKTLYFDCFAGASGDMILGAMVAAGVDPRALLRATLAANVQGYSDRVSRQSTDPESVPPTRGFKTAHEHTHRHLSDILKII